MSGYNSSNRGEKIPKSVCYRNQARNYLQSYTMILTDSYHVFILDEINRGDTIEYEIYMIVYNDE